MFGIEQSRMIRHFNNKGKSIRSCRKVPLTIKILQNFWLTQVFRIVRGIKILYVIQGFKDEYLDIQRIKRFFSRTRLVMVTVPLLEIGKTTLKRMI